MAVYKWRDRHWAVAPPMNRLCMGVSYNWRGGTAGAGAWSRVRLVSEQGLCLWDGRPRAAAGDLTGWKGCLRLFLTCKWARMGTAIGVSHVHKLEGKKRTAMQVGEEATRCCRRRACRFEGTSGRRFGRKATTYYANHGWLPHAVPFSW